MYCSVLLNIPPAVSLNSRRDCGSNFSPSTRCDPISTIYLDKMSNRSHLSIGVWLLALAAVDCNAANVQPGDRDHPQTNLHPTKLLMIHGTIDASLDIDFRINWSAQNPGCRYAVSRIAGVYSPYGAFNALPVTRSGSSFTVQVPIDGVLPGRCRWSFGGVTFGGGSGFRSALIATNSYPLNPGQSPNGTIHFACQWKTVGDGHSPTPAGERTLDCRDSQNANPTCAVVGGILWWHPEASDLKVDFTDAGQH
jgi:hypothetical protein